mmetsp:Transcript_19912/g.63300  ORF Transcript_19912/g.63300 Transcript_19912/m.63300 type:complete len:245 (+) Transcript_19912:1821-2555(+)
MLNFLSTKKYCPNELSSASVRATPPPASHWKFQPKSKPSASTSWAGAFSFKSYVPSATSVEKTESTTECPGNGATEPWPRARDGGLDAASPLAVMAALNVSMDEKMPSITDGSPASSMPSTPPTGPAMPSRSCKSSNCVMNMELTSSLAAVQASLAWRASVSSSSTSRRMRSVLATTSRQVARGGHTNGTIPASTTSAFSSRRRTRSMVSPINTPTSVVNCVTLLSKSVSADSFAMRPMLTCKW